MSPRRTIVLEDSRQHCACGHEERDHALDLRSCLHRSCDCEGFDHSPEMEQLAVDEFFARGAHHLSSQED